MRRYLVVANLTLHRAELQEELRKEAARTSRARPQPHPGQSGRGARPRLQGAPGSRASPVPARCFPRCADGRRPVPGVQFRSGIPLKRVVSMRKYLVVANQTLHRAELQEELRKRINAGSCSFFVLVPNTRAAQYDAAAADGVLLQPSMWWWVTDYAPPATDEEATGQARQRLSQMLADLAELGVPVQGDLGMPARLRPWRRCSPITSSTRSSWSPCPRPISRWLRADLPRQAERRFGLPVTTIITKR